MGIFSTGGLILAMIIYFILKLLYNGVIIILIVAILGRLKAKGQEVLRKNGGGENGEE